MSKINISVFIFDNQFYKIKRYYIYKISIWEILLNLSFNILLYSIDRFTKILFL